MTSAPRRLTLFVLALAAPALADSPRPTIDDIVSLKRPGEPALSPDGRSLAYTVPEADWSKNAFLSQIWRVDVASGTSRQLTRGPGSCSSPAWSPDGRRLAFLSDREGKAQVYLIEPAGGEAWALTQAETEVQAFAWSPTGEAIAFVAAEPRPATLVARDKDEDAFEVVGENPPTSHLFLIDVASRSVRRLTGGPYAVRRFAWSPDGRDIVFDHRPSDDANREFEADLSIVRVAEAAVRPLVTRPGPDAWPRWSPDGQRIVFYTGDGNPGHHYFANGALALVPAAGGAISLIPTKWDELILPAAWDRSGIYARSFEGPFPNLYLVDPTSGRVTRRAPGDQWITSGASFDRERTQVAFVCATPTVFDEICLAPVATMQPKRLTHFQDQLASWPRTTHELFRWTSGDGTRVEGVLHKPADFQPGKRYPLLVVIHGGPSSYARPSPVDEWGSDTPYPIELWLSPMTYVRQARIPTLIQHGDSDPRVPVPNAKELYRALQDLKVPSQMIFYKGMGHVLTKPRMMRAAMQHNVDWFDRYLLEPEAVSAAGR